MRGAGAEYLVYECYARCAGEEDGPMKGKVLPWKGMIIIAGFFLVVFVVLLVGVMNSRNAMEAEYAVRQAEIVVKEREVAALRTELERVGTDGYVENEARTRYDYVRNGEIRFEFADPDKLGNYTDEEWAIIVDAGLYTTY